MLFDPLLGRCIRGRGHDRVGDRIARVPLRHDQENDEKDDKKGGAVRKVHGVPIVPSEPYVQHLPRQNEKQIQPDQGRFAVQEGSLRRIPAAKAHNARRQHAAQQQRGEHILHDKSPRTPIEAEQKRIEKNDARSARQNRPIPEKVVADLAKISGDGQPCPRRKEGRKEEEPVRPVLDRTDEIADKGPRSQERRQRDVQPAEEEQSDAVRRKQHSCAKELLARHDQDIFMEPLPLFISGRRRRALSPLHHRSPFFSFCPDAAIRRSAP